jgi:hypothetical protein
VPGDYRERIRDLRPLPEPAEKAVKKTRIVLRREKSEPQRTDCTLGFLFVGELQLCTIERPWIQSALSKGGSKGISCVPPGLYQLKRHNTEAHPYTWALVNRDLDVVHLPGESDNPHARTAVLLHSANWAHELRGCIAPGMRAVIDEKGRFMVAESRRAMRQIQAVLPWIDHELEIT